MTKQVQLRRGSHSQHSTFTGAVGEPTIDTTNVVIVIHDGVTAGGHSMVGENLSKILLINARLRLENQKRLMQKTLNWMY